MGEDRRVARSLERRALLDQLELELFELMVVSYAGGLPALRPHPAQAG